MTVEDCKVGHFYWDMVYIYIYIYILAVHTAYCHRLNVIATENL